MVVYLSGCLAIGWLWDFFEGEEEMVYLTQLLSSCLYFVSFLISCSFSLNLSYSFEERKDSKTNKKEQLKQQQQKHKT